MTLPFLNGVVPANSLDAMRVVFTPAPQVIANPPPLPVCRHEGPTISLCSSGDIGHVRQCAHPDADWDNCRRDWPPGPNEQRCSVCPLHSRHEIGRTRHLLYFIYPRAGSGVWQDNVRELVKRIDLFNGKRIIAIATGQEQFRPGVLRRTVDSPDKVKAMFPAGCEFLEFPNNHNLGECVAWEALWAKVLPGEPGDVTFYAHAKGGKWGKNHPYSKWIKLWRDVMYETCLDDWPTVQEQLKQHPVVGTFKKLGHCFVDMLLPQSSWHFSGSFYFVRNADWYARKCYRSLDNYMTSEAMPGIEFKPSEGGALLYSGLPHSLDLYQAKFPTWEMHMLGVYRKWREARGLDAAAAAG